ncbi:MAG: hypothetical protein AAF703_23425 [Cyanobacteria bacterium P01_D01_bin.105]
MRSHDATNPDIADPLRRIALHSQLRVYTEQLIKITEAGRNPTDLGRVYYNIASVHEELDRLEEAEVYCRAAAYSFELVDEPEEEAQAWLQVGVLRAYLGFVLIEPVQDAFERSRRAAKRADNYLLQAQAIHHLGRLKQEQGDWAGALTDFESALYFVSPLIKSDDDSEAVTLHHYILEGIGAVQLAQLLRRARELAERTNQDAETPNTAPGDPPTRPLPPPLPSDARSSQGSRFWWWRRRR